MTVDKFGHYFNQKYSSEGRSKNILTNFGFTLDGNNIDFKNKRIINVAAPLDGLDAANKTYVNSQIKHMQENLKSELRKEYDSQLNFIKHDIKKLQESFTKETDKDVNSNEERLSKTDDNILKWLYRNAKMDLVKKRKLAKSLNKDFVNSNEEGFNEIKDYILKMMDRDAKMDLVKKESSKHL